MDTSKIFQGEADNYDGVTVTITEAMDATVFTEKLRASLSHWRQEVFKTTLLKDLIMLIVKSLEFFFSYSSLFICRGRGGFGSIYLFYLLIL